MAERAETSPLARTYAPRDVEAKWYGIWERSGAFHAERRDAVPPYTIVIPPPNVTGVLHMGHILNNTMQDVLIRYKRMTGFEACWIPGTDHAGIATQNVVERSLGKEGKTRHDLGRAKFVERVWEWKRQYGGVIVRQLRTLGASCDWARERFTMDDALSASVREVFVRLYEEGLIYRGKYIVNWCPKDHTAISDDEVTYTEQQGKLYYIRYPLVGGGSLTVATTRPETMLGDSAVAVHPDDKRYASLIGARALLPLAEREIPVIADAFVDPSFGTGMVKVTPAHDPNDYWIGVRHNLPQINIFDVSARTNESVPERYRSLDRAEARELVLADLRERGLLEKTEDHPHSVGRCYRCDTVIEPWLSDQWFVRMQPLAAPALAVVQQGLVRLHPGRWTKVYEHWMTGIRDWCISRQLWWGHRIPVWYCASTGTRTARCAEPIVSRNPPGACPGCGSADLRQDEDVLDTWFSSWLWPFSVHGWPAPGGSEAEADLKYFYPTDALVTAPEIIFFWVARMVMAGLKFGPTFTGSGDPARNIPFRDVYFTSTVRDTKGRKMSKSLGNSPEPLDLIAEYGADAVRYTILALAPVGADVIYAREKNELGRNFANKIWNAGRFLLMNAGTIGEAAAGAPPSPGSADLADRWILSRLHSTLRDVETAIAEFEFNRVTRLLYDFLWHDYCDWYVEMLKSRLYGTEGAGVKAAVLSGAIDIFDAALRLLHPVMPFVTEELWQALRVRPPDSTIMRQRIPDPDPAKIDTAVERQMAFVQGLIEAVRTIRSDMSIPPSAEVALTVTASPAHPAHELRRYEGYLQRLARVARVEHAPQGARPPLSATAIVEGEELFIPLAGLIDLEREQGRLAKELQRVDAMLQSIRSKLSSEAFTGRAPADVVAREREKLASFETTREKLARNIAQITAGPPAPGAGR